MFLSELKPVLPTPEQVRKGRSITQVNFLDLLASQVGKLNIYCNADVEELAGLHPSDRLMVKLIQIERLGPRIEGMLYKSGFEESWSLLDDVSHALVHSSAALMC